MMVDSFFWHDPEELEAREEANQEYEYKQQWNAPAQATATDDWDAAAGQAAAGDAGSWAEQTGADDWSAPAANAGAAVGGW